HLVVEGPTRRRQGDDRANEPGRVLDTARDGLGTQHHPGSPAVGGVVHAAVHVIGGVSKIVDEPLPHAALTRATEYRGISVSSESLRKESQNVDAQRHSKSPSGTSTSMSVCASTEVTNVRGTSAPVSRTNKSLAGFASTSTTVPRTTPAESTTRAPKRSSIQMTSSSCTSS